MNISVFGLGYVGSVTSACLADMGHRVIGVDIKKEKVESINRGKAPIFEKDLDALMARAVDRGRLASTTNVQYAINNSELSLICVGTPSNPDGSLNLEHVKRVCRQIGDALKHKRAFYSIVIRSTMLPGSTENVLIPILEEASGKKNSIDFGVCVNPEFMREGTSVYDFYHPQRIVIGESCRKTGDFTQKIYEKIDAPTVRTSVKVAELIKYVDNSFHGLKIAFANEIGRICKELGINSHEVMNIFCMDRKLNLSPYYLKPGFAFGGSCLPKDIKALSKQIGELGVSAPLIKSILDSNEQHTNKIAKSTINFNKSPIGIFGLAFKGGTDDLRNSAALQLANILLENEREVFLYDPLIKMEDIQNNPDLAKCLLDSEEELVEKSKIIVLNNKNCKNLLKNLSKDKVIVDLGKYINPKEIKARYYGICW